jgi:methyl-accepting chemotaxis protein
MAQTLADGDLRGRVVVTGKDEVGELAASSNSLAESLGKTVIRIQQSASQVGQSSERIGQIAHELRDGCFTTDIQFSNVASATEQLSVNFHSISLAAEKISTTINSVSSSNASLNEKVNKVAAAAEATSKRVAEINQSIEAMTAAFLHSSDRASDAANATAESLQKAEHATQTISSLEQSSSEIGKITQAIKLISMQTNLLALNATIEATSAGEAGKGFTVVASEIKQLALQCAKAADDISRRIETVQVRTHQSVTAIEQLSKQVHLTNQWSNDILADIQLQAQAATEISNSLHKANVGVKEIAVAISDVTKLTSMITQNANVTAIGASDVSRNVSEAASAARSISSNVGNVQKASKATVDAADRLNSSSNSLVETHTDLSSLVSRFQV